jgi:hypothetical protein
MLAALLVTATLAACTEVSTDPQFPVSLQFDSMPSGAVVLGDTMRGDDLLPAAIPARAYNAGGGRLSDSLVRLIGIDTASVKAFGIIGGLQLIGKIITPAVKVVAQAGALQSQTQTFAVVPVPTQLGRFAADSADSVIFDAPDSSRRFVDVKAQLVADTVLLSGLRIKFRVVSFPTALLDSVRIVSSASGRTVTSAISASGSASVRLKTYPKAGAVGTGVISLEASSIALGRDVPQSPLPFRVRLIQFTLPASK